MSEEPIHTESSAVRPNTIYVERLTYRALFYVPREPGETIDGLANKILVEWIKANHPLVVGHLQAVEQADKIFRKEYGKKTPF